MDGMDTTEDMEQSSSRKASVLVHAVHSSLPTANLDQTARLDYDHTRSNGFAVRIEALMPGSASTILVALLLLSQRAAPLGEDRTPSPRVSRPAWVTTEGLSVLVEPEEGALVTARLKVGRKVIVRAAHPPGWLTIAPPDGSFSWIEKRAVEDLGEGRGQVIVSAAAVRPGRNDAALPTGPYVTLRAGAEVVLLDRPPLILRQGEERRVWYAIEPPASEVRYIRSDGVAWSNPALLDADTQDPAAAPSFDFVTRQRDLAQDEFQRLDPEFVAVGPIAREVGLSPSFESELQRIEKAHRSALMRPIETWSLDPIAAEYQKLQDQTTIGNEKQAVEVRLAQLRHQANTSKAARSLREMIENSRQRDSEFKRIRERLANIASGDQAPYDAEGLLQTSSAMLDGHKALVLINDAGKTEAYLVMPPGLQLDTYLATRVGIRGDSRYDSRLKARVITVGDIDRLDPGPR